MARIISRGNHNRRVAGFTETEIRLLRVMADGKPHKRDELRRYLYDELSGPGALRAQVWRLNVKLLEAGQRLLCVMAEGKVLCYQRVRLLVPGTDLAIPRIA